MTASLEVAAAAVDAWLKTARRPLVVGLCGAQGSGKSTLARKLCEHVEARGGRVAVLSIDDLYLSHVARQHLAETVHPLFATRGVPGTHDVALGVRLLDDLKAGRSVRLPRFDKGSDDPFPEDIWLVVNGPVDLVVLEGWCVGAVAQNEDSLAEPINALEMENDPSGLWRRTANAALAGPYADLFARIDRLILLAAPDFAVVRDWRTQQEHGLRYRLRRENRSMARVMSDAEVARFIQFYERLTRHILAEMPKRADLVLELNTARKLVHWLRPERESGAN